MTSVRVVVYGNAGSGKTTTARTVAHEHRVPHLDLDTVAWSAQAVRKPVQESIASVLKFIAANQGWVIEGCYGDLVEAALPSCTDLRFLNPGVETCILNCRSRPWEPHKYAIREEQDRMLSVLIDWVRNYETREDEFSLARHRAIYDTFTGTKREFRSLSAGS